MGATTAASGVFTDWLQVVIGMENMILRGTRLKNTDYIYGIVVYTGPDTRLAMNSNSTGPKFSTVEK
jgi:magnesium-transporting ATPase (P-type)